jgi:hypothetical protein
MPFLLNATWRMKDVKFAEFKRRTHNSAETAAIRLQNRMVRKAREVAAERTLTGAMQRGIRGVVTLTDRGVRVALEDPVWYAHFQDRGTKRGVSPLLFLEQGLAEGKNYAIDDLEAEARHLKV